MPTPIAKMHFYTAKKKSVSESQGAEEEGIVPKASSALAYGAAGICYLPSPVMPRWKKYPR
jgi:hypothetical protein